MTLFVKIFNSNNNIVEFLIFGNMCVEELKFHFGTWVDCDLLLYILYMFDALILYTGSIYWSLIFFFLNH